MNGLFDKKQKINVTYPFGEHDLLTTIISYMFNEFQETIEKSHYQEIDHNVKRIALEKFQRVFEEINTTVHGVNKENIAEPIEELIYKADATNLNKDMLELIEYCNYDIEIIFENMFGNISIEEERYIRRIERYWNLKINYESC